MATAKMMDKNKWGRAYGGIWILTRAGETVKYIAARGNSLAVLLQMLNTELSYDSTIPQPDICPSEIKTYVHRNSAQMFLAVFTIAPKWIQLKCPSADK